jgi:hypothetical protein
MRSYPVHASARDVLPTNYNALTSPKLRPYTWINTDDLAAVIIQGCKNNFYVVHVTLVRNIPMIIRLGECRSFNARKWLLITSDDLINLWYSVVAVAIPSDFSLLVV